MPRQPRPFPDDIHCAFARRVRGLRLERELSQAQLAERMTLLGVPMDRTAIARIEQAAIESEAKLRPRKVSISEAAGFAEAFVVPLAAVLPYDIGAYDYSEPVTRKHFDKRMDEFKALATGKPYEAVRVTRVRQEAKDEHLDEFHKRKATHITFKDRKLDNTQIKSTSRTPKKVESNRRTKA